MNIFVYSPFFSLKEVSQVTNVLYYEIKARNKVCV